MKVRFQHQEDPLEEGTATHSSILAWRTPWTEEPGELYSPWGHKESDTTEATQHTCMDGGPNSPAQLCLGVRPSHNRRQETQQETTRPLGSEPPHLTLSLLCKR